MVQLSSDSKVFGNKLVLIKNAQNSILRSTNKKLITHKIKTLDSLDRVVAKSIIAPINVPPYSNSAVDGYAFKYRDIKLNKSKEFNLVGKSKAGTPYKKSLKKNEIVRVLTGAIIPKNADTVVMEEDCIIQGKIIFLPKYIKKGINFRLCGEDIKINTKVFDIGHKIKPQDIGILSSLGIIKIPVFKKITISIFSCGDELIDIKNNLKYGKIYDSNKSMLISFLNKLSVKIIDLGILKDNKEKIIKTLNNASKSSDLIISSGAMSLGDEDHIKNIIENLGELKIWRLAIKPGRPVGFGKFKNTAFLGLPGNPAAAFVTFLVLGIPLINKLSGQKFIKPIMHKIPISFHYKKKLGRKEFLRVKLDVNKNILYKYPKSGAGILKSTSWANGLGIIDEKITQLKPNDKILFVSFNELLN